MKTTRITFYILLTTLLVWTVGCAGFARHSDPLAGWNLIYSNQIPKSISNDYQDYIQKLPAGVRYYVQGYNIRFFEDSAGQHAAKISIPLNGTWREHILIYNKDDKRINVIKYSDGEYRS